MNVERGIFEDDWTPEQRASLEAAIGKARQDPGYAHLFDPAEDEASLARAEADVAAGRLVPHEEVAKWLKTWGTPDFKPMPREWLE